MDYFYQTEDKDGLRFAWNIWPPTKVEATLNVVPLGCMYTPLKAPDTTLQVKQEPLVCRGPCKSILSPHCSVDLASHSWQCPICLQKNQFPSNYQGMSATNLPPELLNTTIEYITKSPKVSPAFLFVVDLCLSPEDLAALKDSLLQLLEALPQTAYVGLITFGHHVQVYELAGPGVASNPRLNRAYSFNGEHEISARDVHLALGVGSQISGGRIQANPQNNFVVALNKCRDLIENLIEGLLPDPFPLPGKDTRPMRATGVAANVAVALLENTFAGLGGRIMIFMGGAATIGPGLVVGSELKEAIRSHNELRKEAAPRVHGATRFYDSLAERAANNSHAIDLFSCSLNQTGLLEMRKLCTDTGGVMILADDFQASVFQQSISKMFERDGRGNLRMGFAGTLDVFTCKPVRAAGCVGPVTALPDKGTNTVSDNAIGIGGNSFRLCAFDPQTTVAVYFDLANAKDAGRQDPNRRLVTQFQMSYQHANGYRIIRVTTIAHSWATSPSPQALIPGIDQECAAALMARLAVFKNEKSDTDPLTFIDQHLIKFMKRFGQFHKGNPTSFVTPPELSLYAQFMYYFRRGPLVQVFNNSPDETVFFRYCLAKEVVSNILIMMQPSLDSYVLDDDPTPVFLSASSVTPNNILLLDTFFHIVVHTGANIAAWRKEGYHLQPDYENLKELIEMPKEDAARLMHDRMPLPMYVDCDQATSQARFLIASVDPAITHLAAPTAEDAGQRIFTEDASLQTFIDKLVLIVCSE